MKNFEIEIKYAFISAGSIILWMLLEKIAGFHDSNIHLQPIITNLYGIVGLFVYFFALREKKMRFYRGKMSWSQGFLSGIFLSTFLAVLSPLYNTLIIKYVSPSFLKNMAQQFDLNKGQQVLETGASYYNLKSFIFQSCIDSLSFGILASAILALFISKKSTL